MRLRHVLLHVGPPKTGTTTIQVALAEAASELGRHGYHYPAGGTHGQPWLAWEAMEAVGIPVVRLTREAHSWSDTLAEANAAKAHTLIISAEDFAHSGMDEAALHWVRDRLRGCAVRIVFALRDPEAVVRSVWQHSVRWNAGGGEQWMEFHEAAAMLSDLTRVRVVPFVNLLERSLRPVHTGLFTVPRESDAALLIERFVRASGLPLEGLLKVPSFNENVSLPSDQTALLLRFNQALASLPPMTDALSAYDVRGALLRALQQWDEGGRRLQPSPSGATEQLRRLRADILAWLDGRHVVGDVAELGGLVTGDVVA